MVKIILNGEDRTLSKACNLTEALNEWGYKNDMPIAVAVNNVFVPKQDYAKTQLEAENRIEVLMPMQGG